MSAAACWVCVVLGVVGCRLQEGQALDWSAQRYYERGQAFEARGDDTAADHAYERAVARHPDDPWAVLATLRSLGWTRWRAQEESVGRRHGGKPASE